VDLADEVIAVWDGQLARGHGGAGEPFPATLVGRRLADSATGRVGGGQRSASERPASVRGRRQARAAVWARQRSA
jgi:hypothetical protein